jgi:hypothetical protein
MSNTIHAKNKQTGKSETIAMQNLTKNDWGFCFFVDTELEAFKAAYEYRNNPHGCRVEFAGGVKMWMVTVFNEFGAKICK